MKTLVKYLKSKNIPFNILPIGIQLNRMYKDFEVDDFCYKNKIHYTELDSTILCFE